MNTTNTTATPTKLRSVSLTTEELKKLKAFAKKYPTQERIAEALGISRVTYLRIVQLGSGSEDNINKVRQKLTELRS